MWPDNWKSGVILIPLVLRENDDSDDGRRDVAGGWDMQERLVDDLDQQYLYAAEFCAQRDQPWQDSLLAIQLDPKVAARIADDRTGFAALVRQFAYETVSVLLAELPPVWQRDLASLFDDR